MVINKENIVQDFKEYFKIEGEVKELLSENYKSVNSSLQVWQMSSMFFFYIESKYKITFDNSKIKQIKTFDDILISY